MLNHLKNATNVALTENGAQAYATTKNHLLDLFAQGGALRNRSEKDIITMFTKALGEDADLATRLLFYIRDVRGGMGERRTFQVIIKYLGNNHPEIMRANMWLFAEYGRWDDIYELFGTKVQKEATELIKKQLEADMDAERPSLLGKWLHSENTSGTGREAVENRRLGKATREALGLSKKEYRKALSGLREKVKVTEKLMSQKRWDEIKFDQVPSKAGMIYRTAFFKNDKERYEAFLEAVNSGEKKVNSSTLFPYELVSKAMQNYGLTQTDIDYLNGAWANLPNYLSNENENSIAVVDVSGSMEGLPMEVAISLGLYMAERSKGPYANHFITFTSQPMLQEVAGSTFVEKVRNIQDADWGMNTNIEGVFDLILNTAIKNKIRQDEMVGKLYIISDMEFDAASSREVDESLFKSIERKYAAAGYTMPGLVFWNVDARQQQFPMTVDDRGVLLVSGASPRIFEHVMKNKVMDPVALMMEVLESDRYKDIYATGPAKLVETEVEAFMKEVRVNPGDLKYINTDLPSDSIFETVKIDPKKPKRADAKKAKQFEDDMEI